MAVTARGAAAMSEKRSRSRRTRRTGVEKLSGTRPTLKDGTSTTPRTSASEAAGAAACSRSRSRAITAARRAASAAAAASPAGRASRLRCKSRSATKRPVVSGGRGGPMCRLRSHTSSNPERATAPTSNDASVRWCSSTRRPPVALCTAKCDARPKVPLWIVTSVGRNGVVSKSPVPMGNGVTSSDTRAKKRCAAAYSSDMRSVWPPRSSSIRDTPTTTAAKKPRCVGLRAGGVRWRKSTTTSEVKTQRVSGSSSSTGPA